jgi:hypothetical protein
LCDAIQEKKCRQECGEELIEWTCSQCEKKRPGELNDYTLKMFKVRQLKKAGYPFTANDLTLEEWEDLGQVEEALRWPTKTPYPSN